MPAATAVFALSPPRARTLPVVEFQGRRRHRKSSPPPSPERALDHRRDDLDHGGLQAVVQANEATYEGLEHLAASGPPAQWEPMPAWATVLCRIGAALSLRVARNGVVVASLPFRDFAVALVALGYVVERVQAGSFEDRFKPGDLVLTVHKTKEGRSGLLAEFRGYLPPNAQAGVSGVALLRARHEPECRQWRTGGTQLVRYSGRWSLPKRHAKAVPLPLSSFRTALVGPDEDAWLAGRTLVGLVGHFPNIHRELAAPIFRYAKPVVEGTLGEVLLLDGNLRVAGTTNPEAIEQLGDSRPELVIFDGATSFGKWRHRFNASNHAVVMDRASPLWVDELSIVRSAVASRSSIADIGSLPSTEGTGIDLLGFCR